MAYVRGRRLRRCRELLADPARRDMSIVDMAAAHGFSNAANFARAFRRSMGLSERAVRMLALSGDAVLRHVAAVEDDWRDWRDWMALMR